MSRFIVVSFLIVILFDNEAFALEKASRQKRYSCIVIQKQTGGKADSGEGSDDEDYDYKRPEPKAPPPDRLREKGGGLNRKNDVENVPPELLKYKKIPNRPMYQRLRMKNRLLRKPF